MNITELKQIQLSRQYLTDRASKETVLRNLCGIQCQFLNSAIHALSIRCTEKVTQQSLERGVIKNWTIRGTLHMILEDDLPVFKYEDGFYRNDRWTDEFCGDILWISGERKKYFAEQIVKFVASGIESREELRLACREAGMTEIEESYVFDGWGGLLRPMCERGFIQYKVTAEKAFQLGKPYTPMDRTEAIKVQCTRYLHHFAPATIDDICYFFKFPKRYVKELLRALPVKTIHIDGKEYFYLGEIEGNYADIPECIFLAGFDQLMLGYLKTESIYLKREDLRGIFNLAGIVMPGVLLNGTVVGTWKHKPHSLEIKCFRTLSSSEKEAIESAVSIFWDEIKTIRYENG